MGGVFVWVKVNKHLGFRRYVDVHLTTAIVLSVCLNFGHASVDRKLSIDVSLFTMAAL